MLRRRRPTTPPAQTAGDWCAARVWWPKYPVWAMRDGYIPVYTVGMVNTRYIPVFLEYSDPSTVSRLRVEPPRAAPVPPRHALGDAARMLRWAYYSLLARATAGWGAVVGLGVRGRRARAARRGSGSPRPSPAAAAYPSTGRPKAKYPVWENGPGYLPVYTGILPYRYIPSEIPERPYPTGLPIPAVSRSSV